MPGAKTFIVLMNMGSDINPSYTNTYNSANTHIDLFGLDPYPVKTEFKGANYNVIVAAVKAAEVAGVAQSQIVPVYQAFGGGGYSDWIMPTPAQEHQILSTWGGLTPNPAFDYVYSWGEQSGDTSLADAPTLQQVFAAHNRSAPQGTVSPSQGTITVTDAKGVTAVVPLIASGSLDFTGPLAGGVHQAVSNGIDMVSADAAINAITVRLGSGTQQLSFAAGHTVDVIGGSGSATVKTAGGTNTFVAGSGTLDVTGGSGPDSYIFHAGDGLLRIEDFSRHKGDTLAVDKSLQGSLQTGPDGHGGVMLTFGSPGQGVDVANRSFFSSWQIQFV